MTEGAAARYSAAAVAGPDQGPSDSPRDGQSDDQSDGRATSQQSEPVLVDRPIDVAAVQARVAGDEHGAVLLFLGNVRNHHQGRQVAKLVYSAYRPMAEQVLRRIARELEAGAKRLRLAIVHRLGEVPVGEASVVIAVASPHREAAYDASRRALERLKKEAPIWKREQYADGETVWREEESLVPRG